MEHFFYTFFFVIGIISILQPTHDFSNLTMKNVGFYILVISSFSTLMLFYDMRKAPQIVEYDTSEIEYYLVYFDYYTLLIPFFLILSTFVITLLSRIYYPSIFIIDSCLKIYSFALYLLIASLFIKIILDSKANLTIKMANNIFSKYLYANEECRKQNFYVKKFTYYLNKSIINIDRQLVKGLKLNDLKYEKNLPINFLIKKYMRSFLTFCTQQEIEDLKNNLYFIPTFMDREGEITSLEITKYILKIYKNIKLFLADRKYKAYVSKISRSFNYEVSSHWFIIIFFLVFSGTMLYYNDLIGYSNTLGEVSNSVIGTLTPNDLLSFIKTVLEIFGLIVSALYSLQE